MQGPCWPQSPFIFPHFPAVSIVSLLDQELDRPGQEGETEQCPLSGPCQALLCFYSPFQSLSPHPLFPVTLGEGKEN